MVIYDSKGGLYSFSLIPTLNPEINQSSRGWSGKCCPVQSCWFVAMACQELLWLVCLQVFAVVSLRVMQKTSRPQVRLSGRSSQAGMFYFLLGICNQPKIFVRVFLDFYYLIPDFEKNPNRRVGYRVGSSGTPH